MGEKVRNQVAVVNQIPLARLKQFAWNDRALLQGAAAPRFPDKGRAEKRKRSNKSQLFRFQIPDKAQTKEKQRRCSKTRLNSWRAHKRAYMPKLSMTSLCWRSRRQC